MPDFLPDPLVSALQELSDPTPIEPGPAIEPPSASPRRTGAAVAAATLAVGIVIGAAAAPGPAPSTAASAYTIKVFGAGGATSAPDDSTVASATPAGGASDGALASAGTPSAGTTAEPNDDNGTATGTGVPSDSSTGSSGDSSSGGSGSAAAPASGGGSSNPSTTPGPVWVISAGAVDLNDAIAHDSGIQALAQGGVQLENYTPLADAELANGVALLSGKNPNETFTTADTLAGQLRSSSREWKAYVEDLDVACSPAPVNDYDPDRNPFVHFTSIPPADCVDRDVDLSALDSDLGNPAAIPDLSWIVPDTTNDGTGPGGVADLEHFLTTTIDKITATDAYKAHGLILIVPDGQQSPGQPTGALLLSPSLSTAIDTTTYSPYSLLRGLEDRLGLPALAHAGDPTSSPTPIPSH